MMFPLLEILIKIQKAEPMIQKKNPTPQQQPSLLGKEGFVTVETCSLLCQDRKRVSHTQEEKYAQWGS